MRRSTEPGSVRSVLALNGSLDLQVLASQNLPPMRAALMEAGNTAATSGTIMRTHTVMPTIMRKGEVS